MKRAYWTGTGSSRPSIFSTRSTRSGGACGPVIARAGLAGTMKKITKDTKVSATRRTAAQTIRRTRYRNA